MASMSPKIFITGGTGFIGGSVLHTIVSAHPEYEVTALLRNIPPAFSSTYPNVKVVKGDYDSSEILKTAASQADIVLHNGNSDHEPSLNALIAGLLERPTPGFLVHLSGSGLVADHHEATHLGTLNSKVWSDVQDVGLISSRPPTSPHRNTEKILFDTIDKHGDRINIAIMAPPDIYGKGLGLAKTASVFVPVLVEQSKNLGGRVFYYGEGTNTRSWVHVRDLMKVYSGLVEAAVNGGKGATWGREGYYFAATQEVSHIELVTALGKVLKKLDAIEDAEPLSVPLSTIDSMVDYPGFPLVARYLFAANSRTRADRATKLFRYEGNEATLLETLEEDVRAEILKTKK